MMAVEPARRPRGRPTAGAAQAREQDVLHVAATLFEQQGFAGVTMAEVARRARISKTTLYARYPDKQSLFRAICSYACRVPAHRIGTVEVSGRAADAVLADFAAAIADATSDPAANRFLRLAIFEARRFPEMSEQIRLESRAVTAPLAAWLGNLGQQGRLPGHDPAMLARQFVALVTGGHDALLHDSEEDRAQRIAAALALVLTAIRAE